MGDYETLIVDKAASVLRITLNRPKANAFNHSMIDELNAALKDAGRDPQIRCLVLTGSGKMFSAGQDVTAFSERAGQVSFREHLQGTYNPLIKRMRGLEKPILGVINGPAAGAALGIALACDLRIASEEAKFVFGFTGIGLTADSGTSLTLPLLIGLARASHMAFTNEPLTAAQALEYGLVNKVVPAEALAEEAEKLAAKLAKGPTKAIGLTKRAFNHSQLGALESVLDYEAHLQEIAGQTRDHQEGLDAFLEKRPPEFSGE
ncbi:MAG: enoyl-CoA hydratase/isomerase family protein [Anaerolineales bacterium]